MADQPEVGCPEHGVDVLYRIGKGGWIVCASPVTCGKKIVPLQAESTHVPPVGEALDLSDAKSEVEQALKDLAEKYPDQLEFRDEALRIKRKII